MVVGTSAAVRRECVSMDGRKARWGSKKEKPEGRVHLAWVSQGTHHIHIYTTTGLGSCFRGGWRPIVLATDVLAAVLFLNAAIALLGAHDSVNPRMHTNFFWSITDPPPFSILC